MQYKEDATYKVCQQQHDKLLLLQSFAKKWVESEITMERAKAIVEDHNERFNPGSDADYWAPDELFSCMEHIKQILPVSARHCPCPHSFW